jgi:hypothetical protein
MAAHVADIEAHLHVLETAFSSGDSQAIEQQCERLQRSLADSLVAFRKAEQAGLDPLSADLRARLKLAQSRVQAQQLAVHRGAASIDRTLNVLFPQQHDAGGAVTSVTQGPASVTKALKNAYR